MFEAEAGQKEGEEMADIDLALLIRQNERIIAEMASLRDDMRVLTSIVLRQDGTLTAVLEELRATHAQIARMNDRILKLEDSKG